MGFVGLLITVVIIILFIVFTNFSNFTSKITPKESKNIQTEAQEVMDSEAQKAKSQQNQIKNIDLP